MTKKQHQILDSAIHLFSENGFHSTSTSKIAKHAKVSEGLIFRHFVNKEGLLTVLLKEMEQRFHVLLTPIILEEDPKQVLRKTLEALFIMDEAEMAYWKLQTKLKWEIAHDAPLLFEALEGVLTKAFDKLRYKNASLEATHLLYYLDGLSSAILRNKLENPTEFKQFLLRKYYIDQ